jgi:hypothetical protein
MRRPALAPESGSILRSRASEALLIQNPVHCGAMGRLQRLVLCWVMSVSFMLMPHSTLHAHVSEHEHTHVHGGHVHDFDRDHDVRSVDHIVKISVAATTATPAGFDWTVWLPIVCVLTLLSLSLPFVTAILRPPSRDSEPIRRRPFWQPPLRGPPSISIPAL